ncbi:MAG: hypothetical protein IPP77_04910 [Bacteroidetes bacterium]|nr:hypothetical protein [Bacteroidota bacterium]
MKPKSVFLIVTLLFTGGMLSMMSSCKHDLIYDIPLVLPPYDSTHPLLIF